jgi:hypothetical protein
MKKLFAIARTWPACPEQFEGLTSEGESIDIRVRWGRASIEIDGVEVGHIDYGEKKKSQGSMRYHTAEFSVLFQQAGIEWTDELVAYSLRVEDQNNPQHYLNTGLIRKGSKIFVKPYNRPFVVKIFNSRYIIATKPFNALHTVLYTIIDLAKWKRGPHNLIFNPYDFQVERFDSSSDQFDIPELLADLSREENPVEISHRKSVDLDITKIVY